MSSETTAKPTVLAIIQIKNSNPNLPQWGTYGSAQLSPGETATIGIPFQLYFNVTGIAGGAIFEQRDSGTNITLKINGTSSLEFSIADKRFRAMVSPI